MTSRKQQQKYHPNLLTIMARALKPATDPNDEAFEMKVLHELEPRAYSINVEQVQDNQIRFTLPIEADSNLRLRVWLKRVYREIDAYDTEELDRLIEVVKEVMPNIPVIYSPKYVQLHYEGN